VLHCLISLYLNAQYYSVTVDSGSGRLKKISNEKSGSSVDLDQQFNWYQGSVGPQVYQVVHNSHILYASKQILLLQYFPPQNLSFKM